MSIYSNSDIGTPDDKGVVGLRVNLRNTDYINATIQCLAQTPQIIDYFLQNDYIHHVNKENTDGDKGQIAMSFALLLHDIWSNKYRTIDAKQFKSVINEIEPKYINKKQDAKDFLSFLLNGLHEDLNQIINKPIIQNIKYHDEKDKIVAIQAWKTYLQQHQSIIVDKLTGQYKSKIICPDCCKISISFDSYRMLSVPIPMDKHKVIEYTWIDNDTSIPTVYGIKILKTADINLLKQLVAKRHNVLNKDELFVCDVWKSKIHRELKDHDGINEINNKSDDIIIYHVQKPNIKEWNDELNEVIKKHIVLIYGYIADKERVRILIPNELIQLILLFYVQTYQTFYIWNEKRIYGGQQRYEDEPLGFPLLITLPMTIQVKLSDIRKELFKLIKPYLNNQHLKCNDDELPFKLWSAWGDNNYVMIINENEIFDLHTKDLKFIIHWRDPNGYTVDQNLYNRDTRLRDVTAPNINNRARGGRPKPIDLSPCIEAFCEEQILDTYCTKCKEFKPMSKRTDLWNSPDLLIIHLNRFTYTKNWRDRINTLVKFPVHGLDLSPYLLDNESRKNAIYDCYGILNHMGGMGGNHYTAYAKNLDNNQWYHFDDATTSKLHNNTDIIVSSAAYILFYHKRNP